MNPIADLSLPYLSTQDDPIQTRLLGWLGTVDIHRLDATPPAPEVSPTAAGCALLSLFVQRWGLYSLDDLGTTLRHYPDEDGELYPDSYERRDGLAVRDASAAVRRLDWLLEHRFDEAYGEREEEEHWDDPDIELPAGPGPMRSGFLALGDASSPPEDRRPFDGELDAIREAGRGGRATEAWRPVATFADWIDHVTRLRVRRDVIGPDQQRAWPHEFPSPEAFERAIAQQRAAFEAGCLALEKALHGSLFASAPTLLVGAHTAWDRYDEDWLCRDHVAGAVWDGGALLLHRMLERHYA